MQFAEPRRVRAIEQHGGDDWVFVEGSDAGIPMEEVIVEARVANPVESGRSIPILPEEPKAHQEKFEGRLSRNTTYQLLISGDLGPKEIGNLIKVLQTHKEVLSDDEEG